MTSNHERPDERTKLPDTGDPTPLAQPAATQAGHRAQTPNADEAPAGKLIPESTATDFRSRWESVQHDFVDKPRHSITEADKLVTEIMERLAVTFDAQRRGLESQWHQGEPSTEDLRTAFQRYRTFMERLLNV